MRKLKWIETIKKSKTFLKLRAWAEHSSLPGFAGVPILDILDFLRQELKKEKVIIRANAMAFSFFISLFPSILFLFSLLPYLPIGQLVSTLEGAMNQLMPEQTADYLMEVIAQITTIQRGGLIWFTLILAFFFSSNGIMTMLRGFEKSYKGTYKKRTWIGRRLTALLLTVILGTLLILSLLIIVMGRVIVERLTAWAQIDNLSASLFLIFRWVIMIALIYAGITSVYRYGPALRKKFHFLSPGASIATILSILSSLLFSYYVNNFGTYDKLYGSIGALIAMMLWFQINSLIILLGYELNASIAVTRDLQADDNESG